MGFSMPYFDLTKRLTNKVKEMTTKLKNSLNLPFNVKVIKGKPMYTLSDVHATFHPIAKLIRLIFIDRNITKEEFAELHSEYAEDKGQSQTTMNNDRNNHIKALCKPRMTIDEFLKVVNIIGLREINISFELLDPKTGISKVYGTKNLPELCKEIQEREKVLEELSNNINDDAKKEAA